MLLPRIVTEYCYAVLCNLCQIMHTKAIKISQKSAQNHFQSATVKLGMVIRPRIQHPRV